MVYDVYGYMFFADRIGDTYRWKGENVATIEVENAVSKNLNSIEVVVYGVEIVGQEGRAGMAAIKKEPNLKFDFKDLSQKLKTDLPPYAKPLFIRLLDEIEHTGN
jgi:solute carrier family 27 fatty acid transporter 1/4